MTAGLPADALDGTRPVRRMAMHASASASTPRRGVFDLGDGAAGEGGGLGELALGQADLVASRCDAHVAVFSVLRPVGAGSCGGAATAPRLRAAVQEARTTSPERQCPIT